MSIHIPGTRTIINTITTLSLLATTSHRLRFFGGVRVPVVRSLSSTSSSFRRRRMMNWKNWNAMETVSSRCAWSRNGIIGRSSSSSHHSYDQSSDDNDRRRLLEDTTSTSTNNTRTTTDDDDDDDTYQKYNQNHNTPNHNNYKHRYLIVDTDVGFDDLIALQTLLEHIRIRIRNMGKNGCNDNDNTTTITTVLITTVGGIVSAKRGAEILRTILLPEYTNTNNDDDNTDHDTTTTTNLLLRISIFTGSDPPNLYNEPIPGWLQNVRTVTMDNFVHTLLLNNSNARKQQQQQQQQNEAAIATDPDPETHDEAFRRVIDFVQNTVHEENSIEILCLGPLTNLAKWLTYFDSINNDDNDNVDTVNNNTGGVAKKDKPQQDTSFLNLKNDTRTVPTMNEFVAKIKYIYVLGGNIPLLSSTTTLPDHDRDHGTTENEDGQPPSPGKNQNKQEQEEQRPKPTPEFNFGMDPKAVQTVFSNRALFPVVSSSTTRQDNNMGDNEIDHGEYKNHNYHNNNNNNKFHLITSEVCGIEQIIAQQQQKLSYDGVDDPTATTTDTGEEREDEEITTTETSPTPPRRQLETFFNRIIGNDTNNTMFLSTLYRLDQHFACYSLSCDPVVAYILDCEYQEYQKYHHHHQLQQQQKQQQQKQQKQQQQNAYCSNTNANEIIEWDYVQNVFVEPNTGLLYCSRQISQDARNNINSSKSHQHLLSSSSSSLSSSSSALRIATKIDFTASSNNNSGSGSSGSNNNNNGSNNNKRNNIGGYLSWIERSIQID